MKKIFNYIKLIRPLNLIIIIVLQCIIKFFLINQFINEPALSKINFSFFLLSIILITAAGYIINDIYDEKIDKINKNEKIHPNQKMGFLQVYLMNIFLNLLLYELYYQIKK